MSAQPRRRSVGGGAVAAAAMGVVLTLGGCAPSITAARLAAAIGPTFGHLYALQRSLLGLAPPTDPSVQATCSRTGRGVPDSGAGDDWICQLQLAEGGQYLATYAYDLTVKANGCYVADGPPGLVGGVMLTTPAGASRVNPLFAFDGCFDT